MNFSFPGLHVGLPVGLLRSLPAHENSCLSLKACSSRVLGGVAAGTAYWFKEVPEKPSAGRTRGRASQRTRLRLLSRTPICLHDDLEIRQVSKEPYTEARRWRRARTMRRDQPGKPKSTIWHPAGPRRGTSRHLDQAEARLQQGRRRSRSLEPASTHLPPTAAATLAGTDVAHGAQPTKKERPAGSRQRRKGRHHQSTPLRRQLPLPC